MYLLAAVTCGLHLLLGELFMIWILCIHHGIVSYRFYKTKKKVLAKKSATKKRSKKSRKNNKLKTNNKQRGEKMSAEAMKVSSVLDTSHLKVKFPFKSKYGNYINGKFAEPLSGKYFEILVRYQMKLFVQWQDQTKKM